MAARETRTGAANSGHRTSEQGAELAALNPLEDPVVQVALQRVQLTGGQLVGMSVKELNRRLAGCPSGLVGALKKCRRTLKNRGYARNCRIKRLVAKSQLEQINARLTREIRELRQRNKLLALQVERLSASAKNHSIDAIDNDNDNNNNNNNNQHNNNNELAARNENAAANPELGKQACASYAQYSCHPCYRSPPIEQARLHQGQLVGSHLEQRQSFGPGQNLILPEDGACLEAPQPLFSSYMLELPPNSAAVQARVQAGCGNYGARSEPNEPLERHTSYNNHWQDQRHLY